MVIQVKDKPSKNCQLPARGIYNAGVVDKAHFYIIGGNKENTIIHKTDCIILHKPPTLPKSRLK